MKRRSPWPGNYTRTIGWVLACFLLASASGATRQVTFLTFQDATLGGKPWKLASEMPKWLARSLPGEYKEAPRGFYGLERDRHAHLERLCGEKMRELVVAGEVREFAIRRHGLGTGAVANFSSYSAAMEGSLFVKDCSNRSFRRIPIALSLRDGEADVRAPYVFVPLVKDKHNQSYRDLDQAAYGDTVFQASVAGRLNDSLLAIISGLAKTQTNTENAANGESGANGVRGSGVDSRRTAVEGRVVHVVGADVYIDLGSQAGLRVGDSLTLFRRGAPILDMTGTDTLGFEETPLLRAAVSEVRSEKLAILSALERDGQVTRGDGVRIGR